MNTKLIAIAAIAASLVFSLQAQFTGDRSSVDQNSPTSAALSEECRALLSDTTPTAGLIQPSRPPKPNACKDQKLPISTPLLKRMILSSW